MAKPQNQVVGQFEFSDNLAQNVLCASVYHYKLGKKESVLRHGK